MHKINLNLDESYKSSSEWINNKKATINRINKKDNKCFECAVTIVLNNKEMKKVTQEITKMKPYK